MARFHHCGLGCDVGRLRVRAGRSKFLSLALSFGCGGGGVLPGCSLLFDALVPERIPLPVCCGFDCSRAHCGPCGWTTFQPDPYDGGRSWLPWLAMAFFDRRPPRLPPGVCGFEAAA